MPISIRNSCSKYQSIIPDTPSKSFFSHEYSEVDVKRSRTSISALARPQKTGTKTRCVIHVIFCILMTENRNADRCAYLNSHLDSCRLNLVQRQTADSRSIMLDCNQKAVMFRYKYSFRWENAKHTTPLSNSKSFALRRSSSSPVNLSAVDPT